MRLTIQNKLLLPSLTALVILILCSTLLVAEMIASRLEENFRQQLDVSNSILLKGVNNAAVNYKDSVRAMAATARLRSLANILSGGRAGADPADLAEAAQLAQGVLEGFARMYASFPVVNIAGPDGLVVAGSNKEAVGKVNIGKRAYFHDSMQGETVISEPLMSMDIHDKAMVVSTPLLNAAGKPAGVLYAILPCRDVVASTIEGVRIGKTGYAYIVDNGGLMLAHPDAKLIQEFDARKLEWGRQVLASPQGTLRYTTSTGVDRLLNFRLDPESGWIAVTCLDISEINETTAHIRNAALGIMLAGAAIVGLIIFLVTRPIIRDLLQCVTCAKAIAEGAANTADLQALYDMRDMFGQKSVWAFGGDGWLSYRNLFPKDTLVYHNSGQRKSALAKRALFQTVQFIFLPKNSTSLPMNCISSSNWSGVRLWAPSHLALAGLLWTSIIRPSAPAATAALASSGTIQAWPQAWLGSTMTGRWVILWSMTTPARSSVLRILVSKVRMPRSQRITFSLPSAMMYSALITNSSSVLARPRLSRTGFFCSKRIKSAHCFDKSSLCCIFVPQKK